MAANAEAAEHPQSGSWTCPSCSTPANDGFCPKCGEKRAEPHDFSIRHFVSHAGELFFHWDSKIFRSLRLLITRPGFLASEYVRGCRKPYIHPFQMFFIANLLYFLLYPMIGWSGLKTPLAVYRNMFSYSHWATGMAEHRAAAKGMTDEQFKHAFDHVIDVQSRSLVLIMVPIFAGLLWLLEWRKRRFFGEHLVFSFYFHAFWLIVSQIVISYSGALLLRLSRRSGGALTDGIVDHWMSLGGAFLLGTYLLIALRRFYGNGWLFAVGAAATLAFLNFYVLQLYRLILFLTALYST